MKTYNPDTDDSRLIKPERPSEQRHSAYKNNKSMQRMRKRAGAGQNNYSLDF